MKKCKVCKKHFEPFNSLAKACSVKCAIKLAESDRAKKEAKQKSDEIKRVKSKLKALSANDRPKALREAQKAVNAYIRLRDKDKPCISCGRNHQGQYHAGHYRSVGSCPELRFNELNIHKQCMPCNSHLSGNLIEYRKRLIEKIGLDKVEWLENYQQDKKLTIDEIRAIESEFKEKVKKLKLNGE